VRPALEDVAVPRTPTGFRAGSRFDARIKRVVANRRIFPFLVLVTVGVGLLAGFVATLVDEKDFPTFGDGVWWAIVTLATVGYGDIVPTTPAGRLVGSTLIIFGITFLSFLTAIVTSLFVSAEQDERRVEERDREEATEAETRALLLELKERLTAIEAKLD
jgi:voltage-gated potassium channel